jgi:hypothetical protein
MLRGREVVSHCFRGAVTARASQALPPSVVLHGHCEGVQENDDCCNVGRLILAALLCGLDAVEVVLDFFEGRSAPFVVVISDFSMRRG